MTRLRWGTGLPPARRGTFLFRGEYKASPLVSVYRQNVLEDYDYTNRSFFLGIRIYFKVSNYDLDVPTKCENDTM
jgi:hypothetical protein